MKLLLICPAFQESFWTFQMIQDDLLPEVHSNVAPLGLASVAALTPKHWQISVVDENVEDIPWDAQVDVVGICGMSNQAARQCEIAQRFKDRGCYVVVGGNHASLQPEFYEGLVDCVVAGEAEHTWPQFCADFERGEAQALYQETGNVDLASCPVPRFDLLKMDRYHYAALQFSRGCPFRCEFCDIIVTFGRKPRTKSPAQIGLELDELRRLGVRNVFFVDDNLIGHKPKCKVLLQFLVDYQRRHGYQFFFGTEASINLSGDSELLGLFRAANFGWVFIGIESPDEAALKETLKFQNTGISLLESIQRIQAHGIDIFAGFIVGFDADDLSTFDRQFRFIQASGITVPMVSLLVAIPKTPLWDRLQAAERLVEVPSLLAGGDNTRPSTNVVPLRMTYGQMVDEHTTLWQRLFEPEAIFARVRNKFQALRDPLVTYYLEPRLVPGVFFRFLVRPLWRGGPRVWYYFIKSLWFSQGKYLRLTALIDTWIRTLALKEFANRTFSDSKL